MSYEATVFLSWVGLFAVTVPLGLATIYYLWLTAEQDYEVEV